MSQQQFYETVQREEEYMDEHFFYTVDYYFIQKHRTTGKILREEWRDVGVEYKTLEEAIIDNPPSQYRYRFIKRYYEIVKQQDRL